MSEDVFFRPTLFCQMGSNDTSMQHHLLARQYYPPSLARAEVRRYQGHVSSFPRCKKPKLPRFSPLVGLRPIFELLPRLAPGVGDVYADPPLPGNRRWLNKTLPGTLLSPRRLGSFLRPCTHPRGPLKSPPAALAFFFPPAGWRPVWYFPGNCFLPPTAAWDGLDTPGLPLVSCGPFSLFLISLRLSCPLRLLFSCIVPPLDWIPAFSPLPRPILLSFSPGLERQWVPGNIASVRPWPTQPFLGPMGN